VFCHRSAEPGHQAQLNAQAEPLIDLGLRLGEGTGAALAWPLVRRRSPFLNEMASFASAGVSEKADAYKPFTAEAEAPEGGKLCFRFFSLCCVSVVNFGFGPCPSRHELEYFFGAIRFFTRLPVPPGSVTAARRSNARCATSRRLV
jgi:hypothetical protein